MRKIKFTSIYLFTLAVGFFILGAYAEWHTIPHNALVERINDKPLSFLDSLNLVFYFLGFLALCSIYFAKKTEIKTLSLANSNLQKIMAELKQSEAALRESEERHRLSLEASPDPIVVYDIQGKVSYVNHAFEQIFGWSRDEVIGNRIDFVPQENFPETKAAIERILQGEKTVSFETRRLTKDGRLLDIQISASRFIDGKDKPAGNIVILNDITERKRAEEEKRKLEVQLQRAEKMEAIGTLAGGVAHDLNNILSAIVGYPDLLLMEIPEDSPLRKSILCIQDSGNKAAAMVQDLLTLARRGVDITEVVNLKYITSILHQIDLAK